MFKFFKKKSIFGDGEIELAAGRIYNLAVKKGIVYKSEQDEILKDYNENEKTLVLDKLKTTENIFFEDDMIKYVAEKSGKIFQKQKLLNSLIKPEFVNTTPEYIQVGNKFYMGITCVGLPEKVRDDWLSDLTKEKSDIDYTIFIQPSSVAALQTYLNDELKKVKVIVIK